VTPADCVQPGTAVTVTGSERRPGCGAGPVTAP
jgi:hypothetical protein